MRLQNRYLVPGAVLKSAVVVALLGGCSGADDKFAAETYDEYTEPLTDAIIGSPSGVVRIGPPTEAPAIPGEPVGAPTPVPGTGGAGGGAGGAPLPSGGSAGVAGMGTGGTAVPPPGRRDAGVAGSFPDGGTGGDAGGDGSGAGLWHFDDCSPTSNFLADSSGLNANAQHALNGSCVPGISGQGVEIRSAKDVVQVPDEPQFTVGSRVAVAAWVHPNTVTGNQPIVIKRLNNKTAFSLGIHDGNIEISVVLTTGTTVISRAPIKAGAWSHVAGLFDGTFLFLFLNGEQFGQVFAAGSVRNVFAPIRIGATTQAQRFDGIIDEVFLSTAVVSKDELIALSCVQAPSTIAVTPASSGPVPPGTTVHYDIAITDNDRGFCGQGNYSVNFNRFDPTVSSFNISPEFAFQTIEPGATFNFGTDVTSNDDVEPGVHDIPFSVNRFSFDRGFRSEFLNGQVTYEATEPTGCFVRPSRELMIKHLSVVDDPVRTSGNGAPPGGSGIDGGVRPPRVLDAGAPGREGGAIITPVLADESSRGVWSFGHLMRELAPRPEDAPAMAERVLRSFLTDQVVNGFTVEARPAMQQVVLDNWPRTPDGALDLDKAPVTLQAIVNRIDIRDLSLGSGGEGRFVFGVNGSFGNPLEFTLIFEFNLPARTEADVLEWATLWHGLSSHPFPSEEYNAALESITRRFTSRNASPGSVNGSALFSFRSNEIALSGRWQLRQFDLSPQDGFFRQVPLAETPDLSFNGSQQFADFVNQNAAAIIAEVPAGLASVIPLQFEGRNFQAGSIFNDLVVWSGPGIVNSEARFHASMNTCNGCHGPETGSSFLQITPRGLFGAPGEAVLSPFIAGTTVQDQFTGEVRTLNDLKRRKDDLTRLVCPTDADAGAPPSVDAAPAPAPKPAPPPVPAPAPKPAPPPVPAEPGPIPL